MFLARMMTAYLTTLENYSDGSSASGEWRRSTTPLLYKLYLHARWNHAFAETLIQHQLHRLTVSIRVAESAVVDPHLDETISRLDRHVARELHRVVQSVLPVVHRKLNAAAEPTRNFTLKLRAEVALDRVAAHRQRQSGLLLPPRAEVNNLAQTALVIGQLTLVDQQPGVVIASDDLVNDLIEGNDAVIEFRRVQPERQVRAGQLARNSDAFVFDFASGESLTRDDDWTVTVADARAVRQ